MKEQKKEKTDIWLYAALLFTSAFVVLLLTAYSQIKLNKSINEYETKIQGEIKQKYVYQYDLKSALQENKKLKDNEVKLEESIKQLEAEIAISLDKTGNEQKKLDDAIRFYNILLSAQEQFEKGDFVKSAELLHTSIDKNILGYTARKKYDYLYGKVNTKAALILYNDGYKLYSRQSYKLAAEKFLKSYNFTGSEYFSDDSLYFAAISFYNIKKKNDAAACITLLLRQYQSSTFKEAASDLQKKLN